MYMSLSPKEVKRSVADDLKARSIPRARAAEVLGMGKQTFSNLLSQKTYFSRRMALRFSENFGYSMKFLMMGEGELKSSSEPILQAAPKAAFGSDEAYISVLEGNLENTIYILQSLIPYCEDVDINIVITNLVLRNTILSQARKTACYIDDNDPEREDVYILESIYDDMGPYDFRIKEALMRIKETRKTRYTDSSFVFNHTTPGENKDK